MISSWPPCCSSRRDRAAPPNPVHNLAPAGGGVIVFFCTLLPAMALGRGGRVTHLAQLAHPATIGLVLAVTFLVALACCRLGLELEGLLPLPLVPVP